MTASRGIRMKRREYHGMSRTRLYIIWADMRRRCYSPKYNIWPWYGAKGIRVCEEWFQSFIAFRDWAMASGYADNLTIDRLDPSKDYNPDNCQWLPKGVHQRVDAGRRRQRKAS